MESNKRIFNRRAFVAIMLALSAFSLPLSGIILHSYSHDQISPARHGWFMAHIIFGILFTVLGFWHIYLNRKAFMVYFKSINFNSLRRNPEMRWAVFIFAIIILLSIIHANL